MIKQIIGMLLLRRDQRYQDFQSHHINCFFKSDAGEFDEPDADSDYDYEESYSSKRKKKKTPAKTPRVSEPDVTWDVFSFMRFDL